MRRRGAVVAGLTLGGNGLGMVRDLLLAALFGAGAATDAFLASWSVPETASPLLLEGLMTLVGVPYLTRAVVAGRARDAVARTFWPVMVVLVGLAGAVALVAPGIVAVIVPGVHDPGLAAVCVRLAAPTIPLLGAAGYLAALLRAHDHQVTPSGVYLAYNTGIIATMVVGEHLWGVRAAAAGLSVGAGAMCLLLLPQTWREIGWPRWQRTRLRQWTIALGIAGPVLCYLLTRQGQTYIERFFASYLAPGSISEVNYAQKVGQVPGTVAIAIALTGFAAIARHAAQGGTREAAAAVAGALRTVLALVVPCTAVLAVLSPLVVHVLFERGEFTASDAAATSATLRVYVLGLPAQAMVTVLVIAIAAMRSSRWLAALSATCGLVATAVVAAATGHPWGTPGIAAADAVGIWVTGVILLRGVWRSFGEDHPVGALPAILRTTGSSLVAALAAGLVSRLPLGPDLTRLAVASLAAAVAGLLAAWTLQARDILDVAPGVLRPPARGRHRLPALDRGRTS